MTPLQSFKKRCVLGATCTFTANWCPTPTVRTVTVVQSAKVAFTHPTRDASSWLDFPKASQIHEVRPGRFQIHDEHCAANVLTYDFGEFTAPTVDGSTP